MQKSHPQPSITTKSAAIESPGRDGSPATDRPDWKLLLKRKVAILSRWLHIYLSMASFAILLFFAVTGLTLNHAEWFAKQQTTVQIQGAVDTGWVLPGRDPAKFDLVEYFRAGKGIQGAVADFRVDELECDISFKGPGYAADAVIERSSGQYRLTITRMGLAAILNDLHKGRDTGHVWGKIIDLSAVLMTFVSLTGMVLILFLYKRRLSGLVVLGSGAVIFVLVYRFWVP
jgi:uncharacterized protein